MFKEMLVIFVVLAMLQHFPTTDAYYYKTFIITKAPASYAAQPATYAAPAASNAHYAYAPPAAASARVAYAEPTVTYAAPVASADPVTTFVASKNGVVDSVTNAVTEKINALASFINSVLQAKVVAKAAVLNSANVATGDFVKSVNGILLGKPVYTKTLTYGYNPVYVTSTKAVPTATSVYATTTVAQPSGGYVRKYVVHRQ